MDEYERGVRAGFNLYRAQMLEVEIARSQAEILSLKCGIKEMKQSLREIKTENF